MSISKFVVSSIALAVLAGGVSQAIAAPHHVKKLHFAIQGVADNEGNEGNEGKGKDATESTGHESHEGGEQGSDKN